MDFSGWSSRLDPFPGLWVKVGLFLNGQNRPDTLAHVGRVALEAARLARRFSSDPEAAVQAGLLHDISAVIPNHLRLETAKSWGLSILPEEEAYPMLLHQQLSRVMARDLFGIRSAGMLSAVSCHTTLRPGSTRLDKVVFVADKIAWDGVDQPPYLARLDQALEISLEHAAFVYLEYVRDHATGPLHPWARMALEELE